MKKTNAARLLDGLSLSYELCSAEFDPADLSAVALAASLRVDPYQVFKTLLLRGQGSDGSIEGPGLAATGSDGLIFMICLPGPTEVDLKKAARASGCKSAALVHLKEVFPLTGYMRGGCSPLAAKKRYPVLLDESAILFPQIYVSAGLRGLQLKLAPDDLVQACAGHYADLCRG